MSWKTYGSIGQLIAGVVSFAFVYFQYLQSGANTSPILWSIFFLFSSTFLIDKLGQLATTISIEREDKDFNVSFARLPGLFAGRSDVVTFANDLEGTKYCVSVCPLAVSVRNTVLRYDGFKRLNANDSDYTEWLDAKRSSIRDNHCAWTEIISAHINPTDFEHRIRAAFGSDGTRYHDWRFLDDEQSPMVQMTIFEYGNGMKEIVFGWQFPGIPHGPCFLIRNEKIVAYFEMYFAHFYSLAKELAKLIQKLEPGISLTAMDLKSGVARPTTLFLMRFFRVFGKSDES